MDDIEEQIQREKTARSLPTATKRREWYPGYREQSKFGEFTVIRTTDEGYLVEYVSGPWIGKFITMPREVGAPVHTLEDLHLKKDQQEEVLDIFYNDFSREFDSLYNYLYRTSNQEPTTTRMIGILREEYPPLFQIVLNKYFQKE